MTTEQPQAVPTEVSFPDESPSMETTDLSSMESADSIAMSNSHLNSTIASNPSTLATNPSWVSIEKDEQPFVSRCMAMPFGWMDFACGGAKEAKNDDLNNENKSTLFNSKAAPYSSQLYRRRRRGENRHRSNRYLSKFTDTPEVATPTLVTNSPKAKTPNKAKDAKVEGASPQPKKLGRIRSLKHVFQRKSKKQKKAKLTKG